MKIIPVEQKSKIEMQLAGENNLCGAEKADRYASDRGKVIPAVKKSRIDNMK